MEVRIGIAESPQIIEFDLEDGTDRDELKASIDAAIGGKIKILWLKDRKGKDLGVPAEKIGFIELGTSDAERRIGFGA